MHIRPGITKLQVLFLVVIVIGLAGIIPPTILIKSKVSNKALGTNNAKEIGNALLTFVENYGSYPSDETKQQLFEDGFKELPHGNDANSYLAQLLASGAVDSESIFYIKNMKGIRKADNQFGTSESMLSKGENGFGYVMLKGDRPLKSPGSIVPLVIAPLIADGSDPRFDPKPFADQYIYLTPDGAVSGGKISDDGIPIAKGRGKEGLFGAGKNSVFGKDIPDVKMPR